LENINFAKVHNFAVLREKNMKTAIVTGGGHGIGKGIVEKLLKEQCTVIVLDINPQYLAELKEEYSQTVTLLCDVGNPDEMQKAMIQIESMFGQIDYLVNNAGISVFESIENLSIEAWNQILSVNLSSIFYLVKFGKRLFSEQSAIVNIASTRALMSEPNGEAYGASKGGIVALTHALAISLGPKTRVNCVSPGWIEVNQYENLSEADHAQHPVGKVGRVENIAETVWFLLSDKAAFITGQNIVVDGGMTKKMIYV
jgi:NAD(P)-dependent dehydrogenase (short-subunit alcohol dehydrogenase family)